MGPPHKHDIGGDGHADRVGLSSPVVGSSPRPFVPAMQALEQHADIRSASYAQAARIPVLREPAPYSVRLERRDRASRLRGHSWNWNRAAELFFRAWVLTSKVQVTLNVGSTNVGKQERVPSPPKEPASPGS